MNKLAILFIRFYQLAISPMIGSRCRFYPTCSQYSLSCFEKFPFLIALWYSIKRILKCNPLNAGGVDLVP